MRKDFNSLMRHRILSISFRFVLLRMQNSIHRSIRRNLRILRRIIRRP